MTRKIKITIDGTTYSVEVKDINADPIEMTVDGEKVSVTFGAEDTATPIQRIETKDVEVDEVLKDDLKVQETPKTVSAAGPIKDFTAPMPGMIISIAVKVGDQVVPGDEICVLEAMKMQQTITATFSGIVKNVAVQPGDTIPAGQTIVEFE